MEVSKKALSLHPEYQTIGNIMTDGLFESISLGRSGAETAEKLRVSYRSGQTVTTGLQIDYCGNIQYENGVLGRVLVDGGYVTFEGATPKYHFYVQDHLGNNRAVVSQTGVVEQQTQYYPSGAIMTSISFGLSQQPYLYSGKELDRMHALDWYDFGARHYDAALLRWHTMDPLCEKYYHISPYAYCAGNPVNVINPMGMGLFRDEDGNYMWLFDDDYEEETYKDDNGKT